MTDATHLTPDQLADLDEGLLDAGAQAAAHEHLRGCERCRADRAGLAGLPALLAASGATVGPVPPEVGNRLDDALARAAEEPAGTAVTRTVTPLRPPERSAPRGLRLLQAAAVVVLLLAGGAIAVSAINGNGSSGGASTRSDSAGAASAPKAAAGGSFPVTASGRDWTASSVQAAAPALLAGTLSPAVPTASGGSSSGSAGAAGPERLAAAPAGRLADPTALAACVAALGAPQTPLAVDLATFKGQPAAIILLPGLSGSAKVDIWVVGADCSASGDQMLYYASVPRP